MPLYLLLLLLLPVSAPPPPRPAGFAQSSRAHTILRELEVVITRGYASRALQKNPHLVLLNDEFYKEQMLPVMAQVCGLEFRT